MKDLSKVTFGVIVSVSGTKFPESCPATILSLSPASSAFRRIRLVPGDRIAVAAKVADFTAGVAANVADFTTGVPGDFIVEVLGLGFGLGSTDEALDFRL